MKLEIAVLAALVWLRLIVHGDDATHPAGSLAWKWHLGVKADSYGYTLAVYRQVSGKCSLWLLRSNGKAKELRPTEGLLDALKLGQALNAEYRRAAQVDDLSSAAELVR